MPAVALARIIGSNAVKTNPAAPSASSSRSSKTSLNSGKGLHPLDWRHGITFRLMDWRQLTGFACLQKLIRLSNADRTRAYQTGAISRRSDSHSAKVEQTSPLWAMGAGNLPIYPPR